MEDASSHTTWNFADWYGDPNTRMSTLDFFVEKLLGIFSTPMRLIAKSSHKCMVAIKSAVTLPSKACIVFLLLFFLPNFSVKLISLMYRLMFIKKCTFGKMKHPSVSC